MTTEWRKVSTWQYHWKEHLLASTYISQGVYYYTVDGMHVGVGRNEHEAKAKCRRTRSGGLTMAGFDFRAYSLKAAFRKIEDGEYSTFYVMVTSERHAGLSVDDVDIVINGLDRDQALRLAAAINAAMGDHDALAELNDMMRPEPESAEPHPFHEEAIRAARDAYGSHFDAKATEDAL